MSNIFLDVGADLQREIQVAILNHNNLMFTAHKISIPKVIGT